MMTRLLCIADSRGIRHWSVLEASQSAAAGAPFRCLLQVERGASVAPTTAATVVGPLCVVIAAAEHIYCGDSKTKAVVHVRELGSCMIAHQFIGV